MWPSVIKRKLSLWIMTDARRTEPSAFDFWLEYLHLQPDLTQWATTFDEARINWHLDLCWQLLREARRRATTAEERALVYFYEGLLRVHAGDWEQAATCYETAQAGLPKTAVGLRFSLLGERGMLARLQGDVKTALAFHQEQYALAKTYANRAWQAEAKDQQAMDYEVLHKWQAAQQALQQALTLYEQGEDIEGLAGCHNRLGLIALRRRHLPAAAKHLQRAKVLFTQLDRPFDLAQVEGNLGNLAYVNEAWEEAEAHYRRALACFTALNVVFDKIGVLNNLGSIALAREDEDQAQRFYEEGLALARELGGQREVCDLLINLGVINLRQGRLDDARACYAEALSLTHEIGDRKGALDLHRRQMRLWLLRALQWLRRRFTGEA